MVDQSYPPQVDQQPVQQAAVGQAAGAAAGLGASGPPQPDYSQSDALLKNMGDPLSQTNSMLAQNRAALAPQQAATQKAAQAYQQAGANVPPQPKQAAPEPQQGMGLQAAGEWVAVASVLGAVAGAMTRRSTTNALAAFTGALEGAAAGNKQAFEQNKTIWEQENKRINQQLQQQQEAYMNILNSKKTDFSTQMLMLQQEAARQHDDVMAQLAGQQKQIEIAKLLDLRERKRLEGVQSYGKIDAGLKKQEQGETDVKSIGDAIIAGDQPPTTSGLYGKAPRVKAYLQQQGFDQSKALLEWQAAQKEVQVLGGPQATRFRQLVDTVDISIERVKDLAEQMQLKGIPALNRLQLEAYINASGNSPNGKLAIQYMSAVNGIKEEMAQAANGGYAPTLPAWELANQQINGNYSVGKLGASLDEVQRSLRYRMKATQSSHSGRENRYTPPGQSTPTAPQPAAQQSGAGAPSGGGNVMRYDAQGNPM